MGIQRQLNRKNQHKRFSLDGLHTRDNQANKKKKSVARRSNGIDLAEDVDEVVVVAVVPIVVVVVVMSLFVHPMAIPPMFSGHCFPTSVVHSQ